MYTGIQYRKLSKYILCFKLSLKEVVDEGGGRSNGKGKREGLKK